jgi:phage tail sheath protein FI
MPEYLSPGVFIEEVPARLKAIEGVSTSTAGFIGPAERGPVAGFPLPFTNLAGFPLVPESGLVLVTSFSKFTRTFGQPLPVPQETDDVDRGYLGHAARAFFDNGGKRLFVARIAHTGDGDPTRNAARSKVQLAQGVRLRLAQAARIGDKVLSLNAVTGITNGSQVYVRRRSDDKGALDLPAGPAVIPPTPATAATPVADYDLSTLSPSDGFTVKLTVDGVAQPDVAVVIGTGLPKAAEIDFGAATFALTPTTDTLQVRVGPATEPKQTVTFTAALATAAEKAAFLNANLTGVQALEDDSGHLILRTDEKGPNARLEVVGGTAAIASKFGVPQVQPGKGVVANPARVTIAALAALVPATAKFRLESDGAGHLRVVSKDIGTGVRMEVTSTVAELLTKLGLPTGATTGTGTVGADTLHTVQSVDAAKKTISFATGIKLPLDPSEVYVVPKAFAVAGTKGPTFHARSPGTWGDQVSVLVRPTDRPLVRLAADAPVPPAGTAPAVAVTSASGFYEGAVVEILTTVLGTDDVASSVRNVVTRVTGSTLTLADPITAPLLAATTRVRVLEIDVVVADESGTGPTETYAGLSWHRGTNAVYARRHYATVINRRSRLVYAEPPAAADESATLDGLPTTLNAFPQRLSGGQDGFPPVDAAGDPDYIGTDGGPGQRTGIQALRDTDEVRIIAAPGKSTFAVHSELINQCALLKYRFALLDGENRPQLSVPDILAHRSIYDTSYAAYYVPWVEFPVGDQTVRLPPTGFVAGVYARTDVERGVHKAPANEVVRGVVGLQVNLTTGEQDVLNPRGVNAIRRFEGRGIRVWGARTLSSDPEFRYVNVRRFLIFLEASIDRGTQYVVFEPNAPETWGRVVDSVSAFLHTQWRSGALFGRRPEDAFFVRCDETTMTADDVQNGRLICNIGVAIVRPAEFVIFRIEQITGFARQA